MMDSVKKSWKKHLVTFGVPLVLLILVAFLPRYGSSYNVTLTTYFLMNIALAVSWTLFSGYTGYISLATAAFFGVGIYAAALFYPVVGTQLPLIVVVLIAGAASFVLAFIVGLITLRLRGIYFAMFTFGLVLLFKEVIYFWEIVKQGVRGRIVKLEGNETIFYYMLGILVVTMVVTYLIRRSKYGLALQSIGENEEAAAHIGINVTMVKILTFSLSAVFMGAAGVIMATKMTYVDPGVAFDPLRSFNPVLMAIFGGFGSIYGPLVGSVLFTYIQETLTTGNWSKYYMLIFGTILVGTILFLPTGVTGLVQNLWRRITGARRAHT